MTGDCYHVLGDGREITCATVLLDLFGRPAIGRLRDGWVERHDDNHLVIAIYTRNGGGNREHADDCTGEKRAGAVMCLGCMMDAIREHPLYVRDADDTFDGTYATVYFRVPDGLDDDVLAVLSGAAVPPRDMSDVWRKAIARITGEEPGHMDGAT